MMYYVTLSQRSKARTPNRALSPPPTNRHVIFCHLKAPVEKCGRNHGWRWEPRGFGCKWCRRFQENMWLLVFGLMTCTSKSWPAQTAPFVQSYKMNNMRQWASASDCFNASRMLKCAHVEKAVISRGSPYDGVNRVASSSCDTGLHFI